MNPAFPHAMVLTVSFVISPVIGLVCHRRFVSAQSLTPASRRQDHTTSPYAFSPVRQRCLIASIASRPASVTIASAPWWNETARLGKCFASNTNAFIFVIGTGQVICPSGTERCGAVALAHTSVIASAAKQSSLRTTKLDCFLASLLAMTECVLQDDRECADPAVAASAARQSSFEPQAGLVRRFAPRSDAVRCTGMTANVRTQPSLRAQRSNPACEPQSWIASSLRSSQSGSAVYGDDDECADPAVIASAAKQSSFERQADYFASPGTVSGGKLRDTCGSFPRPVHLAGPCSGRLL